MLRKELFPLPPGIQFEENVTCTNQLALTLQREQETLVEAIGRENHGHFGQYVRDYSALMEKMRQTACDQFDCTELQGAIRGAGQNLLTLADQLVVTQRRIIDRLLQMKDNEVITNPKQPFRPFLTNSSIGAAITPTD